MSTRANWGIAIASIALLAAGIILSRKLEPDVVVTKVTIAKDTPALRFTPAGSGPHPIALLAHGVFCSKEMFFCYGEALAHAGFEVFSVDLPGHGQSPHRFDPVACRESLADDARALGPIAVFIGHSMGGYVGGQAVRKNGFQPGLFIAIGALPGPFTDGPPLLLMSGTLDEFIRPDWVRARTDARTELFHGCDHVLELYDPRLVNSAVAAACATIGKPPPFAPTCWRWRLAGTMLGWLGTVGLAKVILQAPWFSTRLVTLRVLLFSLVLIYGNAAVTETWVGSMPHWQRLPWYIVGGILFWLAAAGLRRLKLPGWSLLAATGAVTVIAAVVPLLAIILLAILFFIALLAATVAGAIVARRLSPNAGDVTFAIISGYVLGQWMIKFL